jgi:hypothetical protein
MTNWNGFKGRAKRLDDIDLPKLGYQIGVGEDEIHAFLDVETRGTGFDPQGRPRILFERHKFYKYVNPNKRAEAVRQGLANKRPGGYGRESEQYARFMAAYAIDPEAAMLSCSWGLGQVMGFNYKTAGYDTVEDMVRNFMDDEEDQLQAAVNFIKNNKLDDELRRHDWAGFARGYNGSNYRINRYDDKLAEAYAKWKRIKDTPWTPGQPEPIVESTEKPTESVPEEKALEVAKPKETPVQKPIEETSESLFESFIKAIGNLILNILRGK